VPRVRYRSRIAHTKKRFVFSAHSFALALAAALIDVTLGYPQGLARRIGTPSRWLSAWLRIVLGAGARGGAGLAIYLGPPAVAAALVVALSPNGPVGFVVTALVASAFCGRQSLDVRSKAVAGVFEREGPREAQGLAEALGPDEAEPVASGTAAAIAARFADEAAAPTLFILVGGLVGAVLCRALVLAGRTCRERRDSSAFARAVAQAERWTLAPAARLAALWLALGAASLPALRALGVRASRPTAPAEAAMLTALGGETPTALGEGEDPAYLRRALALFRRAAAAEIAALAALTIGAAIAG
jgi:cobalamin biosynthesis protein CobD/CbiB